MNKMKILPLLVCFASYCPSPTETGPGPAEYEHMNELEKKKMTRWKQDNKEMYQNIREGAWLRFSIQGPSYISIFQQATTQFIQTMPDTLFEYLLCAIDHKHYLEYMPNISELPILFLHGLCAQLNTLEESPFADDRVKARMIRQIMNVIPQSTQQFVQETLLRLCSDKNEKSLEDLLPSLTWNTPELYMTPFVTRLMAEHCVQNPAASASMIQAALTLRIADRVRIAELLLYNPTSYKHPAIDADPCDFKDGVMIPVERERFIKQAISKGWKQREAPDPETVAHIQNRDAMLSLLRTDRYALRKLFGLVYSCEDQLKDPPMPPDLETIEPIYKRQHIMDFIAQYHSHPQRVIYSMDLEQVGFQNPNGWITMTQKKFVYEDTTVHYVITTACSFNLKFLQARIESAEQMHGQITMQLQRALARGVGMQAYGRRDDPVEVFTDAVMRGLSQHKLPPAEVQILRRCLHENQDFLINFIKSTYKIEVIRRLILLAQGETDFANMIIHFTSALTAREDLAGRSLTSLKFVTRIIDKHIMPNLEAHYIQKGVQNAIQFPLASSAANQLILIASYMQEIPHCRPIIEVLEDATTPNSPLQATAPNQNLQMLGRLLSYANTLLTPYLD